MCSINRAIEIEQYHRYDFPDCANRIQDNIMISEMSEQVFKSSSYECQSKQTSCFATATAQPNPYLIFSKIANFDDRLPIRITIRFNSISNSSNTVALDLRTSTKFCNSILHFLDKTTLIFMFENINRRVDTVTDTDILYYSV